MKLPGPAGREDSIVRRPCWRSHGSDERMVLSREGVSFFVREVLRIDRVFGFIGRFVPRRLRRPRRREYCPSSDLRRFRWQRVDDVPLVWESIHEWGQYEPSLHAGFSHGHISKGTTSVIEKPDLSPGL